MTFVRAFKEVGIESFRKQLDELRADPSKEPESLWRDESMTETVSGNAEVEPRDFESKFEFGKYAVERFSGNISDRILRSTPGLWSWLASFYLPQLYPMDRQGRRKRLLGDEKYISSSTDIRMGMDKHLLFFPWKLVSIHGEKAKWALSPILGIDSKVLRELATSYRRNVSPEYLLLARRMYFDETQQAIRRGATSHNRDGNLRRLKDVMNQLDLTFDVFGLPAQGLLELLPKREFVRWLPQT